MKKPPPLRTPKKPKVETKYDGKILASPVLRTRDGGHLKLISRAATATPGVIVDDDGVRWCGPIAPEAPSALVEFRLARSAPAGEAFAAAVAAGDPIAIGAVARALPMPTPLADALAARCLEAQREDSLAVASGKRDADARWAAALARVARARGLGSTGAATTPLPRSS